MSEANKDLYVAYNSVQPLYAVFLCNILEDEASYKSCTGLLTRAEWGEQSLLERLLREEGTMASIVCRLLRECGGTKTCTGRLLRC